MLKRFAALLFILIMAGQVSAGICGCLEGPNEPEHSCCKRQISDKDVMEAKGCCDTGCVAPQSGNLAQDRNKPFGALQFKKVGEPPIAARIVFQPAVVVSRTPDLTPFSNHRLKYSRPPNLYLRHNAFLI